MSEELRTFGANFTSGRGTVPVCRSRSCRAFSIRRRRAGAWRQSVVVRHGAYRAGKSGDGWRVVRVAAKLVPYWQVTGSWIGVSFDDRNAMIGVKLAERLNVQPGDSITLVDHNQRKFAD